MVKRTVEKKKAIAFFLFIDRLFVKSFPRKKKEVKLCRALIIEIWGIGDIVLMTSVVETLRKNFPNVSFDLLCKPLAKGLLSGDNFFKEFITFDFPWTRFKGKYRIWNWDYLGLIKLILKLRKNKYDLILDARGDIRNNLLSFLVNGKKRVGYNWSGGGLFLTDLLSFDMRDKHRVDAWIGILNYLGLEIYHANPKLCISEKSRIWSEKFFSDSGITKGDLVVGIHPGARIKTRCWDIEKFSEVAKYIKEKYRAKIIVFVEPEGYGDNISVSEDSFIKIRSSLDNLTASIKRLDLFICNDGGPMHIAAALNVPLIAVFGPTDPVRFGPLGINSRLIIKNDFPCRPCFDYCNYHEALCLKGINTREVLAVVDKHLGTYS